MKLLQTWDTMRTTLEEFFLPPSMEKALRWVERHPQAVVAGAMVLVMAVLLAQTPAEHTVEHDAYNGETPLFV
jgi:hypothetical protein